MIENSAAPSNPVLLSCLLILAPLLASCSLLKARPADDAGFIPNPEVMSEQRDRAPFNGYWVFDGKKYHKLRRNYATVYISPVNTEVVRMMYTASDGSAKTKLRRIQEAEELARYFQAKLKLEIEAHNQVSPTKRIHVAEQAGDRTLSVNIALVQVIPTKPEVNLIGTALGFFVPGGGLIKIAGEGSVAMEGFVAEENAEIIYEKYKDREGQKTSAFTLKDYQRYAHIREVIDDWSAQIAKLLATSPEETIRDSWVVSLNPI
jgi:hypothetical protein